ncbi:helix-turn-helix transcriptional regulator [Candidatus Woesearchaeota archaeon]|nr:helix-turn-helix transcriptional regulator [Candidatus Woesearchaeota archaeon]
MVDREDIQKAVEELDIARTNLVGLYLTIIGKNYEDLDISQKNSVLNGLENIVRSMGNEDFTEKLMDTPETRSRRLNLAFNRKIAVRAREIKGLTRKGLADELGFDRAGYIRLSKYETGEARPSNPPRGEVAKIYIHWLKEHGYDPYKL